MLNRGCRCTLEPVYEGGGESEGEEPMSPEEKRASDENNKSHGTRSKLSYASKRTDCCCCMCCECCECQKMRTESKDEHCCLCLPLIFGIWLIAILVFVLTIVFTI